jgi:cation diffusion facilitator family transporter
MIADGVHSMLDATSNVIGLVGNAVASQPPDAEHPYGHRRFETLASLIIGGVLLLTAWEIVQRGVERLLNPVEASITAANFIVMLVALAVNIAVSTYENREGRRLHSELLLADAEHTRSDIFVSVAVLGSLFATRSGLDWVDPLAALLVVGVIGWAAWRITRRSASILVDRAALDAEAVGVLVAEVAGVQQVTQVRSRGPTDAVHIDLDVTVPAPMTANHSAALQHEIDKRLRAQFDGLDEVRVRFMPRRDAPPDYALIARAEADALGLGVHEVMVSEGQRGPSLKMHVEVDPTLTVRQAHDIVSEFEQRLRVKLTTIEDVLTHIEPAAAVEAPRYDASADWLIKQAVPIARAVYPTGDWHQIAVYVEADGGFALTMHCHVPGDMRLQVAHNIAEDVEARIRAELPRVHRVIIHTEPPEAG